MMKSTTLLAILFLLAPIAESYDEISSDVRAVDEDALARQQAALERIPEVNVQYDESGIPNRIEGNPIGVYRSRPAALRAADLQNLIEELGPVFLATGTETWVERTGTVIPDGLGIIYRLDQYIEGRRVVGGELVLRTEATTHHVVTVDARFLPDRGLPHEAIVSSDDAVERVFEHLERRHGVENISFTIDEGPELLYLFDSERRSALAWRLVVLYSTPDHQSGHDEVYVDSQDGTIIKIRRMRNAALNRKTYTLNFTYDGPFNLLFNEGGQGGSSNAHALAAYANAGTTYNFFNSVFGRDSFDGSGGIIRIGVDYPEEHNSEAFKIGGYYYIGFGNGGGGVPRGADLDTVSHEFSHNVWRITPGLDWDASRTEGAAINEGLSDIMAAIVDAWVGGLDDATWKMFDVANPPNGDRSLASLHPSHVDFYPNFDARLPWESTAEHRNGTIAGLAFKLLVTGGAHPRAGSGTIPTHIVPQVNIGTARNIFYTAAIALPAFATFRDLRMKTVEFAAPYGSTVVTAVNKAWDAVGVHQCSPPSAPSLKMVNQWCYGLYDLSWPVVVGATRYVLQRSLYSSAFASDWTTGTAAYGNLNECEQQVNAVTWFRVRASNQCGCSGWTVRGAAQPLSTCF